MRQLRKRHATVAALLALISAAVGQSSSAAPAPAARLALPPVFDASESYFVGSIATSVVVGDFTGDGRQDVVLGTNYYFDPTNDWKLFLFAQTASGGFGRPVRIDTDADWQGQDMATAAGDVDGDGRTDLVLAAGTGLDVYLQRDGGLTLSGFIDLPGTRQVKMADIDGDSHIDLLIDGTSGLSSLLGTGTGTFGPPRQIDGVWLKDMETGDVTGDGVADIVGFAGEVLYVIAGRGDGTFDDAGGYKDPDFAMMGRGVAIGDFNGDGRNDVAASVSTNSPGSSINLFIQRTDGTLVRTAALPSHDIPEPVLAADMNLDGRTDIVTAHSGWGKAGVYTQRPDGTIGPESLYQLPTISNYSARALAVGDFTGDGLPDMATANDNSGLVVLRSASQVQSWGLNNLGQLGDGTTVDDHTPGPALPVADALAVSSGAYHNLIRTREGQVWSWGLNHVGQLGTGSTVDRSTPTLVPGLTHVTTVAAGPVDSFAIKDDGTLWAWGWNAYGQLGIGSTTDRASPTQVPGLSGVIAVAGGASHTLAVTSDGSVWAWGLNHVGQLGTSGPAISLTPVRVPGVTNVVAVSAGLFHSLALTRQGQVWSWGFNSAGQLGTGVAFPFDPVPRKVLSGASAISAGAAHSAAIVGVYAWTWGSNQVGQLGVDNLAFSPLPVQVVSLPWVQSLTSGWFHNVVVLTNGSTWAWGWNYFGQLGTGNTDDQRRPVRTFTVDAVGVSAGVAHSVALTARGG